MAFIVDPPNATDLTDYTGQPTIRVLVQTCLEGRRAAKPEVESEVVLGDWCEEHGLAGIANALRQDDNNMCWSALAHLWRCFDADFWMLTKAPKKSASVATKKRRPKP